MWGRSASAPPALSCAPAPCLGQYGQALQLAFEAQRKDMGEPDQRVEFGGPDGEAMTVRVIYDDAESSGGFGGTDGWSA